MAIPLIAAGIGALGNIVGGIFGSRSAKKQQKAAHAFEAQRVRMVARDAKLAGIHPLAALGVGASYQNPYTSIQHGGMGNAIGQTGQDIAQAVNDYAQGQKQKSKNAKTDTLFGLQTRKLRAEIAETEARTMYTNAQRHRISTDLADKTKGMNYGNSRSGTTTLRGAGVDTSNSAAEAIGTNLVDPATGARLYGTPEGHPGVEELVAGSWRRYLANEQRKAEARENARKTAKKYGGERAAPTEKRSLKGGWYNKDGEWIPKNIRKQAIRARQLMKKYGYVDLRRVN